MKAHGVILVGLLALAACAKNDAAKKADDKPAAESQTAATVAKKPAPVDEGIDVPTEEKFEEEVAAQITADSDLSKELDQLEKEIGE